MITIGSISRYFVIIRYVKFKYHHNPVLYESNFNRIVLIDGIIYLSNINVCLWHVGKRGPKKSVEAVLKDWAKKSKVKAERVNYMAEFVVDSNFGVPGAILVTNKHQKEFFLESITLEGLACGPVHFPCNSWVQSSKDLPLGKRIFFHNKVIKFNRLFQWDICFDYSFFKNFNSIQRWDSKWWDIHTFWLVNVAINFLNLCGVFNVRFKNVTFKTQDIL